MQICITEISNIININGLFFPMFDKSQSLEHLAEKQLNIPEKINSA
jgi:hypothetical protein